MKIREFSKKLVTGNPFTHKEGKFSVVNKSNYRFNRNIFYLAIISLMLLGGYIFYDNDFNWEYQIYVKCDQETACDNPFYIYNYESQISDRYKKMCVYDWCNEEMLPPGFEFGDKPSELEKNFGIITFFVMLMVFTINHFLYNRSFNIDEEEEINETDKT